MQIFGILFAGSPFCHCCCCDPSCSCHWKRLRHHGHLHLRRCGVWEFRGHYFCKYCFLFCFFLLLCKIKINSLPFFCNSRAWPVLRWTLLNSWDRRSEVPSTRLAAFTFLSLRWAHFKCWWVFWAYFAYPDHVGGLCNMGTRICSLPRERRRCSLSQFLQFSLCSFLQESTRMVTSLHEVKATTGWRSPLSMSWRFPPSGSVLWPLS